MIRYLLDENVTPLYQTQILQREPDLVVWAVGDVGAPLKGTLDPDILIWCEEQGFVLVTNNRTSMPPHLADHSAQDRHVPGIFIFLGGSGVIKQVASRNSQFAIEEGATRRSYAVTLLERGRFTLFYLL